jgi:hypothetical protein
MGLDTGKGMAFVPWYCQAWDTGLCVMVQDTCLSSAISLSCEVR